MKTDDSINCSVRILTYRKILYILLALGVILVMFSLYYTLWNRVPSTIMVKAGVEQTLDFALPASGKLHREDAVETSGNVRKYESANGMEEVLIDFSSPVIVKANQVDTYTMKLKLFGVIPLKDVDVKVIDMRVTGDVRPGRENEKWINAVLRKV